MVRVLALDWPAGDTKTHKPACFSAACPEVCLTNRSALWGDEREKLAREWAKFIMCHRLLTPLCFFYSLVSPIRSLSPFLLCLSLSVLCIPLLFISLFSPLSLLNSFIFFSSTVYLLSIRLLWHLVLSVKPVWGHTHTYSSVWCRYQGLLPVQALTPSRRNRDHWRDRSCLSVLLALYLSITLSLSSFYLSLSLLHFFPFNPEHLI